MNLDRYLCISTVLLDYCICDRVAGYTVYTSHVPPYEIYIFIQTAVPSITYENQNYMSRNNIFSKNLSANCYAWYGSGQHVDAIN